MTGTAKINNDANDKDEAQYFCYFFDNMYDGSDDPDFTLVELDFETYEFFRPGYNHSVKVHV
jgi:general stress protein 26